MAKKPTEKQLYKLKNEWLGQFFEEVKPKEFYCSGGRNKNPPALAVGSVKLDGKR